MSITSTLTTYGQIGVDVLRDAVAPHDATGKTRESIRFVVDDDRLIFLAREFFKLLEKGRGPTTKGPSKEMIENLTEYARARGFENPEKAAWALATKLNRDGDQTHQKGGRVVYSDVMDTFVRDLADALKEDYVKSLAKEVKESFR